MNRLFRYSLAAGLTLGACGGGDDDGGAAADAAVQPDAGGAADAAPQPDAEVPQLDSVTNFVADPSDVGLDLSWTNPTGDVASIVIIAGANVGIDFTPTDGQPLAEGDDVGTDQTVIFVGDATSFSFASIPGLPYNFAAYAVDSNDRYSPVALTSGLNNALGTQSATLSVDLASQVVTVVNPDDLSITATAVYDEAADTLTIETTVQNDTARLLFNLKGLSTAINQGTQAGNTFPRAGGEPSTYYGPESLLVGSSAVRTISLSGIDGTVDPITVDMSFVDAPMIYGGNFGGDFVGVDSSGSGEGFNVDISPAGENVRQIAIAPDGRFIYAVGKNEEYVSIIDTSTNSSVAGADLSTAGLGSGGGVAVSDDGANIYVGYNDNSHGNASDGDGGGAGSAQPDIHLIKFDAAMTEEARLTLATADPNGRSIRNISISPDGATLAAIVSSRSEDIDEVYLVDLATFTLTDTDAVADGTQPVDVTNVGFAEHLTWSEDASTIFVGYNDNRNGDNPVSASAVDAAAFTVATLTPATAGVSSGVMAARNGKLYLPLRNGDAVLTIFDIAGGTQVDGDLGSLGEASGVIFDPSGEHYYLADDSQLAKYNAADDTRVDTDGDPGNGVTDMSAEEEFRAHMLEISPF